MKTKAQIYRAADQHLCFRYIDSTIPLLHKFKTSKPLAIFGGCKAQFVSDLVGHPEDRFSHDVAHMKMLFQHTCLSDDAVCP